MAEAMIPRHACESLRDRFTLLHKGMTGYGATTLYGNNTQDYLLINSFLRALQIEPVNLNEQIGVVFL